MLTLALPYRKKPTSPGGSKKETANPSIQTPKRDKDSSKLTKVHKRFEILISLMSRLSSADVPEVGQSTIGGGLAKSSSTGVRGLGYKNVKELLTAAQGAGVVHLDSRVMKQEQFWRLSDSFRRASTHI
ncbi:hypothetical protein FRC14_001331 [Serendipita sp. 396]|nr:hypothetical protein FRC14_001331 [Serendipita sp. 396]KAG8774304.1 hypothetical protein FRC15_001375 [Serendipita sp. 397]KAG8815456.1 hypothetical protein FRC19_001024 [Serendipita sp. 401]KAG8818162.1 hypothetical protein FRC18_000244 [Serendipita sp. 400]KAG8850973.1 hypothetical protein FRC20_001892 [Serendipita sp. 405]KAG9047320.1 hypothetical protein FS842_000673 [Serendipita sp. 407]